MPENKFPLQGLRFLKTQIEEEPAQEDAPIKWGSMEIWEEVRVERSTELGSNDIEEMANVLTSIEAANILTSGVAAVSVSLVAAAATVGVLTVNGLVPTVSAIFTTASVVTPYLRRPREISTKDKGKEKVVESDVPKKKKLQEQIDAQVAREMEEEFASFGEETLSIKRATKDKEKELWVELKRLFKPDFEDQLWTHTQNLMHDLLDGKLYDTSGVHHVSTKDQEIFMLVEREKDLPL
nr:hypothetical protein [Tanacetum cinerariifolium]